MAAAHGFSCRIASGQPRRARTCFAARLPDPVASAGVASRAELKAELLELTRRTVCGARASPAAKDAIHSVAASLEQLSPVAAPAKTAAWEGLWRLLYTTERDVHAFAALGHLEASQQLDLATQGQYFVTNRVVTPWVRLTAEAPAEVVPPRRVQYRFSVLHVGLGLNTDAVRFSVDLQRLGVRPGGWSDTTFLDDDFRIARNSRGDVLILQRDASAMAT